MSRSPAPRVALPALMLVCSLAACAPPAAAPAPPPAGPLGAALGAPLGARFAIDVPRVVDALAKKPNATWQDGLLAFPALVEARKAQAARRAARYRLQVPAPGWEFAPGDAITSTPAYAKADVWSEGPLPQPDDYLYAASDNGKAWKLDPTTKAVLATATGLPPMSHTAVQLNGDNRWVYLLSTDGFFTVLDAGTLAVKYSQRISQSGFAGLAPFIDYSNGGGFPTGYDEHVWCLARDGSLYRVNVRTALGTGALTVSVAAHPAAGGMDAGSPKPAWASSAAIPYGGGVAIAAGASPVVWGGRAYVGSAAGTFYRVDCSAGTPVVSAWPLAPHTSAQGAARAIAAPVAIDFDGALDVNAAFVPAGDRLAWIDPRAAGSAPVVSPPLALDKRPAAGARAGTLAAFPYTTASTSYAPVDWIAIAAKNAPSPTRWGSGSAVAGAFSTGISCATVKCSPTTGNMWVGHYTSPRGQVSRLTPTGTVLGTHDSTVANCNEITFDAAGNCYATHGASNKIVKFSPTGAVAQTFTMPSNYRALWPAVDPSGNLWVTSLDNDRVVKFGPGGNVLVNVARANALSVVTDALGNAYVCTDTSPGRVVKYAPNGSVLGTYTVGNRPQYIALEPGTGNIWTCNYGSGTVSKLSPAGVTLGTYATGAANPWSIAFDDDGLPWVTCLSGNKVQKLGLTGGVLASYTLTGAPYEIAFDGNGDAWVSCADGLKKLYDLGNLADLFAAPSFGVLGDGDDSFSFLRYRIPLNSYGNTIPVAASLKMTAATTPTTGAETLSVFEASPFLAGSTALWGGYAGTPTADWHNRPAVGPTLATLPNQAVFKDVAYSWPYKVGLPVDQRNSGDAGGAAYAVAQRVESAKVLKRVAHWYSTATAPGAGQRPTLTVTRATGATLPTTHGLRTQPALDSEARVVYVAGCNAVFQLSYASAGAFRDPAAVRYNVTQAGRTGNGPLNAGKYEWGTGNVLMTGTSVVVADRNTGTGRMGLSRLTMPLTGADRLAASLDLGAGTDLPAAPLLYDYELGSVYVTTGNNRVVRADVL